MLVSGSQDTSIVVWDLTSQAGICRLRGHRDEVTSLLLVPDWLSQSAADGSSSSSSTGTGMASRRGLFVVSSSKDTLLKVWDIDAQTCIQTVVGHRSEVWAAALAPASGAAPAPPSQTASLPSAVAAGSAAAGDSSRPGKRGRQPGASAASAEPSQAEQALKYASSIDESTSGFRILTGSSDSMLREFAVRTRAAAERTAAAIARADAAAAAASSDVADMAASSVEPVVVEAMGSIARLDGSRCTGITVSTDGRWAAVFGRGKSMELYFARSWAEVKKRGQRRVRRARERGRKAAKERAEAAREAAEIDADSDEQDPTQADAGAGSAKRGKHKAGHGSRGTSGKTKKQSEDAVDAQAAADSDDDDQEDEEELARPMAGDEWGLFAVVRCPNRVRSVALLPSSAVPTAASEAVCAPDGTRAPAMLVCTSDNQLELYCVDEAEEKATALADGSSVPGSRKVGSISSAGHRKDVRCVVLAADNALALSAGDGQIKLWNTHDGDSLRTMECGYSLCCAFLPGGQHAVVGTKAGSIQVFDLASGDLVEEHTDAHEGAVYSLDVRADGRGVATASADKTVKLWELEAVASCSSSGAAAAAASSSGTGSGFRPSLVHARTLRMPDEVLCVRYSAHGEQDASRRLLAVSLLDSTVKVFFEDSLKFFLSLYGHKLPVTAMDISADSTLIATASADKNVKLWGLDFGDCHKSLFAHDEAVTAVRFVGRTHLFFTAGKDGSVRHWDGDRFVQIHECSGHSGAVWGLDVASDGLTLVTAGADRSVRVWKRTDEQVFLEEEREREAEGALENELAGRVDDSDPFGEGVEGAADGDGAERRPGAPGVIQGPEAVAVAGGSKESVVAADRLLEALGLARSVRKEWAEFELDLEAAERDLVPQVREERSAMRRAGETLRPLVAPPAPRLELLKRTPAEYVLATLRAVAPADREQAILLLPMDGAMELLAALHVHIRSGIDVELCTRYALFVVRLHYSQIVATPLLQAQISDLRQAISQRVGELRSLFGFTRAGLRFLDRAAAVASAGTGRGGFLGIAAVADREGSSSAAPGGRSSSSGRRTRFNRFKDVKLF
jgi:U3 small nucleolar RNA-associated protein 12